jgi:uncharacterized protein YutE (UPF0331/DUF86 family)
MAPSQDPQTDADDDGLEQTQADPESREQLARAKSGDLQAAYDVLGRQLGIDDWVGVLKALEPHAPAVDLELVAHRTMRRPSEVVLALLSLAAAANSPKAAFLAKAVGKVRSEESLIERAEALRQELVSGFEAVAGMATGNSLGALYLLLSRPLADQHNQVARLSVDSPLRQSLVDALREEYERLQKVSKDSRWRSGSYRHILRHSLADLALVAAVGGRVEETAYRLLQQRVDDPQDNRELLALIPEETRIRYLNWALERHAAENSPERALMALNEIEHRFPADVERGAVARLLGAKSPSLVEAAVGYLVRTDPGDGSLDRDFAEAIAASVTPVARSLIGVIIENAPKRLRIDLLPGELDDSIVAESGSNPVALAEHLAALVARASEPAEAARTATLLALISEQVELPEPLSGDIGRLLVADGPTSAAARGIALSSPPLRAAMWEALGSAGEQYKTHILGDLLAVEDAVPAAEQLARCFPKLDPSGQAMMLRQTLDGLAAGSIDAHELVSLTPNPLVEALGPITELEAQTTVQELERLHRLAQLGEEAAEHELAEDIRLLAGRAVERSAGNPRLQGDYERLLDRFSDAELASAVSKEAIDADDLESFRKALVTAGAQLTTDGGQVAISLDTATSEAHRLRALALVDQLSERAGADATAGRAGRAVLNAFARELAREGTAELLLTDLFERGPRFQLAVGLSPTARGALIHAAEQAGFAVPAEWFACSKFGSDFDFSLFEQAWTSDDDDQRLLAYGVQAGYENAINGAVKIAQELCELEGWTPANQEPKSTEALKKLKENGLVDAGTHAKLKDAYESRGDLQHDYVHVAVYKIHEAAAATLEGVPLMLQDVALYVQQRST